MVKVSGIFMTPKILAILWRDAISSGLKLRHWGCCKFQWGTVGDHKIQTCLTTKYSVVLSNEKPWKLMCESGIILIIWFNHNECA